MKIGFLSLPAVGHLHPMTTLARRLQSRGHEIAFIGTPDAESIVRAAGLRYVPFCEQEYPLGSTNAGYAHVAQSAGIEVVTYASSKLHPQRCRVTLAHLEATLLENDIEAMVIDTIHFFAELVPMKMGIPYIHVWNIVFLDRTGASPSCYSLTPFGDTPEARMRSMETALETMRILAPIAEPAKEYAIEHGLDIDWTDPYATLSKLAVITQTPREFDFETSTLPPNFVYAGPLHDDEGRAEVPFPWDWLTGAPLIYASLGSRPSGMESVYVAILEAVARFPEVQTVLSVGKEISLEHLQPIPSNVLVVHGAPQVQLLKRAAICITHAGQNTALECLAQGVPMVAIPIGYDQPGVAMRIVHHGVGEFVEVKELSADRLAYLVGKVMRQATYRANAQRLQECIAATRGVDRAADAIENALQGVLPRAAVFAGSL